MEIGRVRTPRPRISWPRIHNKFLAHRANPTSKHPTKRSKCKLQQRAILPSQQQSNKTTMDPISKILQQEVVSQKRPNKGTLSVAAASKRVNRGKEEKNGDKVNSKNKQQTRGCRRSNGADGSSSNEGKPERREDGNKRRRKPKHNNNTAWR